MTSVKIALFLLAIGLLIWLGYALNRFAYERYGFKPFNWASCTVAVIGVGFIVASCWLYVQLGMPAESFTNQVLNLNFSNGIDEIVASACIGFATLVGLYLFLLAKTDLFTSTISFSLILVFAITIVGVLFLWVTRRLVRRFDILPNGI